MAVPGETWYVRLPDGRRVRARTLDALRAHLRSGRIPWESRARRSGEEGWQPLERFPELSDLLTPPEMKDGVTRSRPPELRTLGVRGVIEELYNAFDSCLGRVKWGVAAGTGLLLALGLLAFDLLADFPAEPWVPYGQAVAAVFLLAVVGVGTYVLTQMTAIELSQFRPARAAEVRDGMPRQTLRLMLAQGIVAGLVIGLMALLRVAPDWLNQLDAGDYAPLLDVSRAALAVVRLLLEVLCWPVLGLALLLLGPVLVIEDYSVLQGLREWLRLLRQHLGRIYLSEALAFALAVVMTLPLLLPVFLTAGYLSGGRDLYAVEVPALRLLAGVALTPLIAYLLVANVFIYLNLRYEFYFTPRTARADR